MRWSRAYNQTVGPCVFRRFTAYMTTTSITLYDRSYTSTLVYCKRIETQFFQKLLHTPCGQWKIMIIGSLSYTIRYALQKRNSRVRRRSLLPIHRRCCACQESRRETLFSLLPELPLLTLPLLPREPSYWEGSSNTLRPLRPKVHRRCSVAMNVFIVCNRVCGRHFDALGRNVIPSYET